MIWGKSQQIIRLAARLFSHSPGMDLNQGTIASDGLALIIGELELRAWSVERGAWSMEHRLAAWGAETRRVNE